MLAIIKAILKFIYDNLTWIVPCFLFCVPPIRDFIIKRFQLSLDKARNDHEAVNERKNYISRVRFDKEFEIYQEISEKNLDMVYRIGEFRYFYNGAIDDEEEKTKYGEVLSECINTANFTTKRYAAFIDEAIYDKCHRLHLLAIDIFYLYECWAKGSCAFGEIISEDGNTYTKETAASAIMEKKRNLAALSDEIIKDVRNYLNTLDVID